MLVEVDPVNDVPDVVSPGTQYALEDTVSKIGAGTLASCTML